jgi:hypothetical protein
MMSVPVLRADIVYFQCHVTSDSENGRISHSQLCGKQFSIATIKGYCTAQAPSRLYRMQDTIILLLNQVELVMSQSTIQQGSSDSAQELGDESFMSATELRNYVMKTEMAKVSKDVGDMAAKARAELIKSLMEPVAVTPEKIAEVKRRVLGQLRNAALKGNKEVLVMRFPNALCSDKGRALNNLEKGWPTTLLGRPLQAFEFWRDHLQPQGYGLKAMIVDWPAGMPGDVGFFLTWEEAKR